MPQNFFALTETDTLYPFGGEEYWITVKQELTAGEQRGIFQAALRRPITDGRIAAEIDVDNGAFVKVATWLVDWNLANASGQTTDIAGSRQVKMDALRALKPANFQAIEQAIDAHVMARFQEKKLPSGSSGSNEPKLNSLSVVTSDGVGRTTARRRATS